MYQPILFLRIEKKSQIESRIKNAELDN